MHNYKSVNPINITGGKDFVFIFDTYTDISDVFELEFGIRDEFKPTTYNRIKISTKSRFNTVYNFSNKDFILRALPTKTEFLFFNDSLYYKDKKLYSKIDTANTSYPDYCIVNNNTYVVKDTPYILCDASGNENTSNPTYIKVNNITNKENKVVRPLIINRLQSNLPPKSNDDEIVLSKDNILDPNIKRQYKIIISDNSKVISLWIKDESMKTFTKVKSFSYSQEITRGYITLSIDESMTLTNLSFSY
jgi:hypothetical protein